MPHEWLDEGLQHTRDREEQQRLAVERRHREASVIKEKGPDLMHALVSEVRTVLDEYQRKSGPAHGEIEFEAFPRGGFSVGRPAPPRVELTCRPDYDAHAVHCNLTRAEDQDGEVVESAFNLTLSVDASDRVTLRHGPEELRMEDAVEFLLKPVLFPIVDHHH